MVFNTLRSLFLFILFSTQVSGASCCGGGGSLPNLITGDYRHQFSLGYSNAATTHLVDSNSDVTKAKNQQVRETLLMRASTMLNSYWQVGLSLPIVTNTSRTSFNEENHTGIGDISLMSAYEFLPEIGYSYWKPRGLLYLDQSLPTSPSTYDSINQLRTDSKGLGLAATTLGVAFIKTHITWDWLINAQAQYFHSRTFNNDGIGEVKIRPGASARIELGKSFDLLRIGLGLGHRYVGKREISSAGISDDFHYSEASLSASYLLGEVSASLSYNDQTLLGPAKNTPLLRTFSFQLTQFVSL